MINLIGLVSAHTGNDMYDHYFGTDELIITIFMLFALVLLVIWLIKRRKNKKTK